MTFRLISKEEFRRVRKISDAYTRFRYREKCLLFAIARDGKRHRSGYEDELATLRKKNANISALYKETWDATRDAYYIDTGKTGRYIAGHVEVLSSFAPITGYVHGRGKKRWGDLNLSAFSSTYEIERRKYLFVLEIVIAMLEAVEGRIKTGAVPANPVEYSRAIISTGCDSIKNPTVLRGR